MLFVGFSEEHSHSRKRIECECVQLWEYLHLYVQLPNQLDLLRTENICYTRTANIRYRIQYVTEYISVMLIVLMEVVWVFYFQRRAIYLNSHFSFQPSKEISSNNCIIYKYKKYCMYIKSWRKKESIGTNWLFAMGLEKKCSSTSSINLTHCIAYCTIEHVHLAESNYMTNGWESSDF